MVVIYEYKENDLAWRKADGYGSEHNERFDLHSGWNPDRNYDLIDMDKDLIVPATGILLIGILAVLAIMLFNGGEFKVF